MLLRTRAVSLALVLTPIVLMTSLHAASAGECCHCPKYVFCRPQAPRIKYKCVCPKPLCPPCQMENFGYYPTCWRFWPFPPNYSHCATPPTIATAPCGPTGAPNIIELPTPQRLPAKPAL